MPPKSKRLHGIDLARFFAFAGMVFVNYHVVTGSGSEPFWAEAFLLTLEGKAAATFVVLAGIGLGMGAKSGRNDFEIKTIKRAVFLFVLGMINSLIFPADILHFYAIYFLFALLLIKKSTKLIMIIAFILPLLFLVLLAIFDFDKGWNWKTYEYLDFWTIKGFIRNLFFNGWHPVIPWLSFLLLGIILSRLNLASKQTQNKMILIGIALIFVAYSLSLLLEPLMVGDEIYLIGTSPVPPMPLYMVAGSGAAILVIGLCLWLYRFNIERILRPLTITGKQALTLYIAHIIIGMGILEALNMIGGQSAKTAIISASLFIIASIIYANIWNRLFKVGAIEWLMRKLVS